MYHTKRFVARITTNAIRKYHLATKILCTGLRSSVMYIDIIPRHLSDLSGGRFPLARLKLNPGQKEPGNHIESLEFCPCHHPPPLLLGHPHPCAQLPHWRERLVLPRQPHWKASLLHCEGRATTQLVDFLLKKCADREENQLCVRRPKQKHYLSNKEHALNELYAFHTFELHQYYSLHQLHCTILSTLTRPNSLSLDRGTQMPTCR